MSMLLTSRFYRLMQETPGVTRKANALVLAWADAIYESPEPWRSMTPEERARHGRDRAATTLGEIHPSRMICHLGRDAMAAWLGYNTDTLTRALTDARAVGLVESWYAPGSNHPWNRLVDPAQAALALEVARSRVLEHLDGRALAPIGGVVPADATAAVDALLAGVRSSYVPRLGNRSYPDWPVSGFKLASLLVDAAARYTGEPVPDRASALAPSLPANPVAAAGVVVARAAITAAAGRAAPTTSARPSRSSKAAESQRDRILHRLAERAAAESAQAVA